MTGKVRSDHAFDRAAQVASDLRGVEQLPRAKPGPEQALLDRAIKLAAENAADEIANGAQRYRDDRFTFGVMGLISHAAKDWPENDRKAIYDARLGHSTVDDP